MTKPKPSVRVSDERVAALMDEWKDIPPTHELVHDMALDLHTARAHLTAARELIAKWKVKAHDEDTIHWRRQETYETCAAELEAAIGVNQ